MIPRTPRPLVIAHRGGRHDGVPGEQGLAHVERAIALGVDFVEVDLRRTRDGRIVCVHDRTHAGVTVADIDHGELVTASAAAGVAAPPLLDELLEVCRGRVGLDLELKVPGIEDTALAAARGFGLDRVLLKSFDDAVVRALKRREPACTAGLLLGLPRPKHKVRTRLSELFPGWRLRACRADFVSPNVALLRLGFTARAHLLGFPVLVWTVNDPARMAGLVDRVDGIITDEPAACLALRARR